MSCPFCGNDPYEYADIGVGCVAVAISCCEAMIDLSHGGKHAKQILRFRRSNSPKKKARARKLMDKYYN